MLGFSLLGVPLAEHGLACSPTAANNHAFAHHVGIKVDDILLDTYTDNGVGIFDNEKISPVSHLSLYHR